VLDGKKLNHQLYGAIHYSICKEPMTIYHTHHIIPKYMGGTDEPDNLVTITVEEHANLHLKLYEDYGDYRDLLAYQGLSKQITQDELLSKLYSENGKNMVRKRKENGWKGFSKPNSVETRKKISATKKGVPNPKLKGRPLSEEHKSNISISRLKIMTKELKKILSIANTGKKYYTNEKLQISRQFDDYPGEDWVKGRKYYKDGELAVYKGLLNHNLKPVLGRKAYSNHELRQSKFFKEGEQPIGWELGLMYKDGNKITRFGNQHTRKKRTSTS